MESTETRPILSASRQRIWSTLSILTVSGLRRWRRSAHRITKAPTTNADATDWAEIVGIYDVLLRLEPSPVVELNRAVAVAMRDGPAAGVALIETILGRGDLQDYHLAHAAHADLCRRLGETAKARRSYQRAITLSRQDQERQFLERRLTELPA